MKNNFFGKSFLFIFICIFALTGCKKKVVLTSGFSEGEIFKINSEVCTKAEMNVYLANMANAYESTFGEEIWTTSTEDTTIEEAFKDTVLAKVSRIKVMNLMAEEEKVSLSSDEKKSLKKAAKAYMKTLSKEEADILGADEDLIYEMYSEYALAEKVYNSIVGEVTMEISDDDARSITVEMLFIKTYHEDSQGRLVDYSDANKAEAKERAEELRELAVTGSDFEELCAMYNEGDESIRTIRRGEMPENFETATFALEEGEISNVIKTDDGYYIVKCMSTYERKETEANKQAIIDAEKTRVFDEKYNAFLDGLIGNLNEKEWENVTIIHDDKVVTDQFFDIYTDIMIEGK